MTMSLQHLAAEFSFSIKMSYLRIQQQRNIEIGSKALGALLVEPL